MAKLNFLFFTLMLLSLSVHICTSDEDNDEVGDKDDEGSLGGFIGGPFKVMGGFFEGAADAADDGMESLKDLSAGVKESSEKGAEMVKGFAEGIGSSFSNAKDKLVETGGKMKEAVEDAAANTKKELETASSKISKHAKEASGLFGSLFG